jgi:hypothetical protein
MIVRTHPRGVGDDRDFLSVDRDDEFSFKIGGCVAATVTPHECEILLPLIQCRAPPTIR